MQRELEIRTQTISQTAFHIQQKLRGRYNPYRLLFVIATSLIIYLNHFGYSESLSICNVLFFMTL